MSIFGYNKVQPHKQSEFRIYALFAVLTLLLLVGVANLVFLVFMYQVLEVNVDGMHSISFFKDSNNMRWLIEADFENIVLHKPQIDGFSDQSVFIKGDNSHISIGVDRTSQSSVSLMSNGSFFKTSNFRFVDPFSRTTILDINSGKRLKMTAELNGTSAKINAVKTPRIVSKLDEDLTFKSSRKLIITGNEGLHTDSKSVDMTTEKNITFYIEDKSQKLEIVGGFQLNRKFLKDSTKESSVVTNEEKYRLCYCENSKQLFRAEITSDFMTCAVALKSPC